MAGVSHKASSAVFTALLLLAGCGGGSTQTRTITGITVLTQPSDGTAYSNMAVPKNQVTFTAYYMYSDASIGSTPVANVQWTGDGANWVSLQGNTATCLQPAPVVILPAFSTVTASTQSSGTTFQANSGLYCF